MCDTIHLFCRLPSTPVGQVLGVNSVRLQKAAGPAEVQHAVSTSTDTQIPVVDSLGVLSKMFKSVLAHFLLARKRHFV